MFRQAERKTGRLAFNLRPAIQRKPTKSPSLTMAHTGGPSKRGLFRRDAGPAQHHRRPAPLLAVARPPAGSSIRGDPAFPHARSLWRNGTGPCRGELREAAWPVPRAPQAGYPRASGAMAPSVAGPGHGTSTFVILLAAYVAHLHPLQYCAQCRLCRARNQDKEDA